jgi:hypothetical protein
MGKKIEIDIAYLSSMGLSLKQISQIIKKAEPDHWTNRLPQESPSYELSALLITPDMRVGEPMYYNGERNPIYAFFTEEDAKFVQDKCRLLIEMSNFAFSVNQNWSPDWNDKEMKKYGIVLQNGQAVIKENELFNVFVFGIVINSLSLAKEMLEEFKDRIEIYFAKPFYSVYETPKEEEFFGDAPLAEASLTEPNESGIQIQFEIEEASNDTSLTEDLSPKEQVIVKRKKVKFLKEEDVPLIQKMLFNKVQQKKIAEYFGYSEGTISLLKKRLGFKMRQMPARIPKQDDK